MEKEFQLHGIYIFFMFYYGGIMIRFSRGLVRLTFKSTKLRWIFYFCRVCLFFYQKKTFTDDFKGKIYRNEKVIVKKS